MKELVDFIVLAAAYVFVFYRKWKLKGKDILFLNTVMYVYLSFFIIFYFNADSHIFAVYI